MTTGARGARERTSPVRGRSTALRAAAALVLLSAATAASGSNYSLYLEPGYLYEVTRVVDSTAREGVIYRQALLQNYRLAVDLDLLRNLVLSASGNFIDTSNWTSTDGQSHVSSEKCGGVSEERQCTMASANMRNMLNAKSASAILKTA